MGDDAFGRTPLHYAALANDWQEVDRLIGRKAALDAPDRQGFTPLHAAAQRCATDAARRLLQAGAKVDATNIFGNTPLFVAVFNYRGDGGLIELLRQYGADPNIHNTTGQTPVGLARLISNYDVRRLFDDVQ